MEGIGQGVIPAPAAVLTLVLLAILAPTISWRGSRSCLSGACPKTDPLPTFSCP